MYKLVKTLKALKPGLRQLCRDKYGDLHNRLESERKKLHLLQMDNLHSPHQDTLHAELIQYNLVQELSFAEEMLLRQKSRVQWIREGDKDHNMVRRKHFRDQIRLLFDSAGNRLTTYDDIAAEAIGFYKRLLGTSDPSCSGGSVDKIRGLLDYHPATSEVDMLIAEVTNVEIQALLNLFQTIKLQVQTGLMQNSLNLLGQ